MSAAATRRAPVDWRAMRAVVGKDLTAIRRSKAVVVPMIGVPLLILVLLPLGLSVAAKGPTAPDVNGLLAVAPHAVSHAILRLPVRDRLIVLVNGYLVAPLFLIVPLMVASVLAADAFAGEKDRHTIEGLLHLPIRDQELFYAKVLSAFVPAIGVCWAGFAVFCVVSNAVAWSALHRVFVPTANWLILIVWLMPGAAAVGMGVMVRVSARARTTQEASQLGGAVILPLIFAAAVQATGLLLLSVPAALAVGAVVWLIALLLLTRGARRFTRDRLAAAL